MDTGVEKKALRAIRHKCLDCSGGSPEEVDRCDVFDCPLYPFRRGMPALDSLGRNRKDAEQQAPNSMALLLPGINQDEG